MSPFQKTALSCLDLSTHSATRLLELGEQPLTVQAGALVLGGKYRWWPTGLGGGWP